MQYIPAADLAPLLNASMSEKAYQWRIVSLAWQLGWWTNHPWSMRYRWFGSRTPTKD